MSLPSRERGLKSIPIIDTTSCKVVAPLAGAWIEIAITSYARNFTIVAPLAGAWIEI